MPDEFWRESHEHRADVLRVKRRRFLAGFGDTQRLGVLDHDVLGVPGVAPFDRSKVRLDAA